jgi:peptide/nickel transport system permease protein
MLRYIGRRVLMIFPVLLLVATSVFLIMHAVPGDPVALMLAGAEAGVGSPEAVERAREQLGLNDPLYQQYLRFVTRAAIGDFGTSIRFQRPVRDLVFRAAQHTLLLSLAGLSVGLLVGIPLGVIAALRRDTIVDSGAMVLSLLFVSMPLFWIGQLMIMIISVRFGWLPAVSGLRPEGMILPALALGGLAAGILSRLTRASLIEVLQDDYVRTARSKGLAQRIVVFRHALRNALIPVVTIAGLEFGGMLSGTVIVETVFSRPGLGALVVNGILWQDYPLIQGTVLVIAVMYVGVNLLVDVIYAWVDPRIRYS